MTTIRYLDFDLSIEPVESDQTRYRARVLNSPAGQASAEFELPFSVLELENFLLRVGRPRRSVRYINSPEMVAVKSFGSQLFEAVFKGPIQGCLWRSLDKARHQEQGLRIRLHVTQAPALADLPWEYLYDSSFNRFFSYSSSTPIVRYLDLPQSIAPLTVQPPLKVLVMIASPRDQAQLDVEAEWRKVQDALADLVQRELVTVTRLEQATLSALQRQLRREQYHIFHFVGHGGFDHQTERGVLLLEDANGLGRMVAGDYLGALFYDHYSLRLTLLNSCEGSRTALADPFAGVAQHLVQQGIPAVIAMQFEITDHAAITLAHEFYVALVDGYPVDAALAEARKAIYANGNDIEWGTPVLFMRAEDGQIFDVTSPPRPAEPLIRQPPVAGPVPAITSQVAPTESTGELGAQHVTDGPKQPQPLPQLDTAQKQRPVARRQPGLLLGGLALLFVLILLWQGPRWFNALFSGVDNAPPISTSTPTTAVAPGGQPPTPDETANVQALTQTAEAASLTAAPTATTTDIATPPPTTTPTPDQVATQTAAALHMATAETATLTEIPTDPPASTASLTVTMPTPTVTDTPQSTNTATLPPGATQTNPKDGAVYVWIPPGEFTMGSSDEDELADEDEKPQRTVEVDGFWIMRTEVTNDQYARCLQERGCKTEPNNDNWNNPEYANHPVTHVTWHQARDYATWVGGRLPTEAEWEKACHGPDARLYPWGDQAPNAQRLNYNSNVDNTTSVGSYPAGANSLYDMAGNVWEWTADWHDENYYANAPSSNPKGPEDGTRRTLRGGSFSAGDSRVRCATRDPGDPSIGYARVGFRVVSPGL